MDASAIRMGASKVTVTGRAVATSVIVLAVVSSFAVGLEPPRQSHIQDLSARAAIETTIAMCGLIAAALFAAQLHYSRRSLDLLLFGALASVVVTDLAFSMISAATDSQAVASTTAMLGSEALVSVAFVAAAFAPGAPVAGATGRFTAGRGRPVALGAVAGIAIVAAPELITSMGGSLWQVDGLSSPGIAARGGQPVSPMIAIGSSALLALAGIGFARRAWSGDGASGVMCAVSFLLAGTGLHIPTVPTDWVTPREGLRLGAAALLLGVAAVTYQRGRREAALEAVIAERRRIARDLHDGLAQDLAFIAGQGRRHRSGLSPEHPLTIAAARALATSRGAIVELAGSTALTTAAALSQVVSEVAGRDGTEVSVQIDDGGRSSGGDDLTPTEREGVLQVTRVAILKAIDHRGARHIDVAFECRRSALRLCVADDGSPIGTSVRDSRRHSARSTRALSTMRARAEALGGCLSVGRTATGGTELELVIPRVPGDRRGQLQASPSP